MSSKRRIGLALSGGGYRAAAYHLGTLRALNKLGILENVDVISSVSGGSIISAYYGLNHNNYNNYDEFEKDFSEKLRKGVLFSSYLNAFVCAAAATLLISFLGKWGILIVLLIAWRFWYKIFPLSFWIERSYNDLFYKGASLSDMQKKPIIAINSTDVSTGNLFTFSQTKMSGNWSAYKEHVKFKHEDFPIARSVMASSCVPFAFSPIRIDSQYYEGKYGEKEPMLIDGGLYDNQGAHKLSEDNSSYRADHIIVSDAGNSEMNSKKVYNILSMLIKTSDIMMNRIKTFQMRNNIFNPHNPRNYAYVALNWDVSERPLYGFVDNLTEGHIPEEIYQQHAITEDDISNLKNKKEDREKTKKIIVDKIKASIAWSEIENIAPTPEEHILAKSVGTNLSALKQKQIDALIKHSSWLAEVQIKMYLPTII